MLMSGTTTSNVAKSLSFEIIRLQVTSGFSVSDMQYVCIYTVGSISTKWSILLKQLVAPTVFTN